MSSIKRYKAEKARDTKKKRYRSRSRSYSPEREKIEEYIHHKKHNGKESKHYDSDVPTEDLSAVKIDNDDKEVEFQLALRKQPQTSSINGIVATIKRENENAEDVQSANITLNATAEFCSTLGDVPTYRLAENREKNDQQIMDFEADGAEEEASADGEEGDGRRAWNTAQLGQQYQNPKSDMYVT